MRRVFQNLTSAVTHSLKDLTQKCSAKIHASSPFLLALILDNFEADVLFMTDKIGNNICCTDPSTNGNEFYHRIAVNNSIIYLLKLRAVLKKETEN